MKVVVGMFVMLAGGLASSTPTTCSMEGFEHCTSSLPVLGRGIVPVVSSLADTCSSWITTKPCLETIITSCEADVQETTTSSTTASVQGSTESPDNTTADWGLDDTGLDDTDHDTDLDRERLSAVQASQEMGKVYDFICDSDNMNEYNSMVRQCWGENDVALMEASDKCHGAYYNDTWWLNQWDRENVYKYCNAATTYLSCQKKAGSNICGDKFGSWVWSYHRALWRPHMDDIECNPDGGLDAGAVAMISICSAAAVLSVVFTIAAFVVSPKTPKLVASDLSAANRRPSSVSVAELSSSNGKAKEPDVNTNGSVRDGHAETVLAPVPEHGILKHRQKSSASTDL